MAPVLVARPVLIGQYPSTAYIVTLFYTLRATLPFQRIGLLNMTGVIVPGANECGIIHAAITI